MNIADKIRESNKEVHKVEARIYDSIHPEIFGDFEQKQISSDIELIKHYVPKDSLVRVLDIGCGTGNLTLKFLRLGYWVRAIDISPEMISILRNKLGTVGRQNVDFVVIDAEEILSNPQTFGTWDIISFSSVLHHLPDYKIAINYALKQLKPGGILYVCHEPLPKLSNTTNTLGFRLVEGLLRTIDKIYIISHKLVIYLMVFILTKKPPYRIDYSMSDYHVVNGIDVEYIIQDIKTNNAHILSYITYASRFSSFLAKLSASLNPIHHSHFRIIVSK